MNSTLQINKEFYLINKSKLINQFTGDQTNKNSIVLLRGGKSTAKYNTSRKFDFHQESYFKYLFGADIPDCYGVLDLSNGNSILFIKKPSDQDLYVEYFKDKSNSFIKEKYGLDKIFYTDDLVKWIQSRKPSLIHILPDNINKIEKTIRNQIYKADISFTSAVLKQKLDNCRVIKSPDEIRILRFVNGVSSKSHTLSMNFCKPGVSEMDVGNYFSFICQQHGCQYQAYQPICAGKHHSAHLHYISHMNLLGDDTKLGNGDIILVDMGAEYNGYISDITCVYPVGNKFNYYQKIMYNSVLSIHNKIIANIKAGDDWVQVTGDSHYLITVELVKHGILVGELDDLIAINIGKYFMPHNLGHFIGLDVHDVGEIFGRHRVLQQGMALAIEPGIYFSDHILSIVSKNKKISKFVNFDKINEFVNAGYSGARIESNVIILDGGCEVMTSVPRTIEEIEDVKSS